MEYNYNILGGSLKWLYGFLCFQVILASIKLLQLLKFTVVFYQLHETLRCSYRYFVALALQLLLILIAFSLLFYLLLLAHEREFSTFGLTFVTLIGRAFYLDRVVDNTAFINAYWFVGTLLYLCFLIFVILFIYSFSVATICFYMNKVKQAKMRGNYNPFAYLRHILTANRNTDILRLRGGSSHSKQPLRLRGGGQTCARCCTDNDTQFHMTLENLRENQVVVKRKPHFSRLNAYEITSARVLDFFRFEAMKRIARSRIEKDLAHKAADRELAMKNIVARELYSSKDRPTKQFYKGNSVSAVPARFEFSC